MFRTLPAAVFKEEELAALAEAMTAEPEANQVGGKPKLDPLTKFIDCIATPEGEVDDEENFGIPAGYTYLGQFIDHDLTFDPASSLQRANDVDGLVDFRTPRFDLDCVYGRGPDDQPYLYEPSGRRFVLGGPLTAAGQVVGTLDVPRFNKRALIGDKRNDENVIVSQLQGILLRFHNAVADAMPHASFAEIQGLVRWHYQWIVLHDFLQRIVGSEMLHKVLPHLQTKRSIFEDKPDLRFYHPTKESFIPIEFAVAAYRFGHSMVRPIYRLNTNLGKNAPPEDVKAGRAGRQFIFYGVSERSLAGFGPFPDIWAIDWNLFFEVDDQLSTHNTVKRGAQRIQPAYKIDTSLVNPLGFLPEFSQRAEDGRSLVPGKDGNPTPQSGADGPAISNLALRNLLRGLRMGLPSGQDVARFMDEVVLEDDEIRIGKATWADSKDEDKGNKPITAFGDSFAGQAPLWTYVLAEAQHEWLQKARKTKHPEKDATAIPVHLGSVGGRIVAEVFVGLLLQDSHSFLSQSPSWVPTFRHPETNRFGMPELIAIATGKVKLPAATEPHKK